MRLHTVGLASLAVFGSLLSGSVAATEPTELLKKIARAEIGESTAVVARNLEIQVGPAVLHINEGALYPATPVTDQVYELVFIGDAVLRLEPPDPVEATQLELFTGATTLEEPISSAVLAICMDGAVEAIVSHGSAADEDADRTTRAQKLYYDWKRSPEYEILRVRPALLIDSLGDPSLQDYFAGKFHSEDLGDFLLFVDPDSEEQLTLGQFVPFDLTEKQKRKEAKFITRQQGKGRYLGMEVDELGTFDTWISTTLRDSKGPYPGVDAFEPEHYTIDATIDSSELTLRGTARIRLKATTGHRRVVHLSTSPDVRIDRVVEASGNELFLVREDTDVWAFLPEIVPRGATTEISVEFNGALLERVQSKVYRLRDTMYWYPHAGSVDRATYEVTIRRPEEIEVVASGKRADKGEAEGLIWETRTIDVPSIAYSFEIGDFQLWPFPVGEIQVLLALDRNTAEELEPETRLQVQTAIGDALNVFQNAFGPYPLDYLTLVTVPRGFAQGLPGFITLATPLFDETDQWDQFLGIKDRRTIIAHELAHQWWGNLVGWKTYRDAWISEAMANYAAMLYAEQHLTGPDALAGPTDNWQMMMYRATEDGLSLESVGPVALGRRLNSSRAYAYQTIVYTKGAVVLNMLARAYGQGNFLILLKKLVQSASNKELDTETFFDLLESLSGKKLDWFTEQFVYGTGIPEVYYSYDFEKGAEGKWRVTGYAQQLTPWEYSFQVVQKPDGRYDVKRHAEGQVETATSSLVVPVQIEVFRPGGQAANEERGKKKKKQKGLPVRNTGVIEGTLMIEGERYEFDFEIAYQPDKLWFDRLHHVFGRFINEDRTPKRVVFYRGIEAMSDGDLEEAEKLFLEALEIEEQARFDQATLEQMLDAFEVLQLDARIRLRLARLYTDTDRYDEAREELVQATKSLDRDLRFLVREELTILESRLDLLEGDAESAYKRLTKKRNRRWMSDTEGYLLLAIAARAQSESQTFETAARVARRRGADLSALE